MHKSYQNGDIILHDVTLSTGTAKVSLLPQLQGMDIFEDMAKPTLYAQLYLFDAINLLTSFPIVGEEDVTISFETPGISEPVTYRLKVFEVCNVQQSNNRQAVGYMLRCISAEHFWNGAIEIKQSWKGQLSDFVYMVTSQYLNSTKKIVIEPTKGIRELVVPKWKPLEALDFAKKNAVSIKYPSSSYVFFENQAGFTFATVEQILEQGKNEIGSRVFTFLPSAPAAKPGANFRSIIEHEAPTRNDTIETITSGALLAETESFDMLSKESKKTSFKISETFPKFVTTDKRSRLPQSATFVDTYGDQSPQRFFHVKDSSRPEEYIEDALAPRNAFKQFLNSNTTRILVHGDSGLKAGDTITLELPEIVGTTGRKELDPLLAGNYIILRLRHVIESGQKPRHSIAADIAKIGYRR